MPHYIVLIGKRASGKDALSSYAEKKYQIPSIRFSSVLAELGIKLALTKPDELKEKSKLQFIGNTIRQKFGEEFYTKKLAERIKGKTHIINGSRHPKEIDCLRKIFENNLITIGIISNDELRFRRTKKQGIVKSKQEFNILESNPAETKIGLLLGKADYKIKNNTTLKALHKKIDGLFSKLRITGE